MIMDDNDGQIIFGDLGGLKLPDICVTGEEKPRKNLTQETCPNRDRTRARMLAPVPQWWTTLINITRVHYYPKLHFVNFFRNIPKQTYFYNLNSKFSLNNSGLDGRGP